MNKTGVERALERGKTNVGRKLNSELKKELEQDLINFEKHKINPLVFFCCWYFNGNFYGF